MITIWYIPYQGVVWNMQFFPGTSKLEPQFLDCVLQNCSSFKFPQGTCFFLFFFFLYFHPHRTSGHHRGDTMLRNRYVITQVSWGPLWCFSARLARKYCLFQLDCQVCVGCQVAAFLAPCRMQHTEGAEPVDASPRTLQESRSAST